LFTKVGTEIANILALADETELGCRYGLSAQGKSPDPGQENIPLQCRVRRTIRRMKMKALTFYRPRNEIPQVLENALSGFDRYLDSFFGDNFLSPTDRIFNRAPSVDVKETEKSYLIEAELPGFDEKDIEIRLDGNTLTISSKKVDEKNSDSSANDGTGNYLIRERRVSSFSRSFKLPENADSEGISASFKNGILYLEINKKAEAQARHIQISKN
jgi:HSP20 family protein